MADTPIDWSQARTSAPVPVSASSSLHLTATGPARTSPTQPCALIIAGHSDNGHLTYPGLLRALSPLLRTYTYARLGYDPSSPIPTSRTPRSASVLAQEALHLLETAGIHPPYILIAHSYGGIIAREMLAHAPADTIHGLVLVDASTESHLLETPPDSFLALNDLLAGLDFWTLAGYDKRHALRREEWAALVAPDPAVKRASGAAAMTEYLGMKDSAVALQARKQLERKPMGRYPVSVIQGRTWEMADRLFEIVEGNDRGTKEDREKVRLLVETIVKGEEGWQRAQMGLCEEGCGRWRIAPEGAGHNLQVTEPGLVAEEVRWVLERLEEMEGIGGGG